MNRCFALLLSLLLLLCGCGQQEAEPETEFQMLTHTDEYYTDGVLRTSSHITYTYNEKGLAIQSTQYDDGVLSSSTDYEYDENGNLTRHVIHTDDRESVTTFTYTLDDRGNILRMESYVDGRLDYMEENTYDARGFLKTRTETTLWEDGEQDVRTRTFVYNWRGELKQSKNHFAPHGSYHLTTFQDGREYQTTYFDAKGAVTNYFTHYYDDTGFEYQWVRCGAEGTVEHTCKREKDETGLVITELHYDAAGALDNYYDVYTYDEYGNQLLRERYENGEVYWRIYQTYEQIP